MAGIQTVAEVAEYCPADTRDADGNQSMEESAGIEISI
jgi:hypothetical protein